MQVNQDGDGGVIIEKIVIIFGILYTLFDVQFYTLTNRNRSGTHR